VRRWRNTDFPDKPDLADFFLIFSFRGNAPPADIGGDGEEKIKKIIDDQKNQADQCCPMNLHGEK
jgi:hypothetical protein